MGKLPVRVLAAHREPGGIHRTRRQDESMNIAHIAPPFERVPPRKYGGTETVIANLVNELVRHGHNVTLFASGDSRTLGRLVPVVERALWHDEDAGYRDHTPFFATVLGK